MAPPADPSHASPPDGPKPLNLQHQPHALAMSPGHEPAGEPHRTAGKVASRWTAGLTILCNMALAAHFLREGSLLGMGLAFGLTALLWSRRNWAIVLNQLGLAGGALIWLGTAGQLLQRRLAEGRPWERMVWILGSVAALSLLATGLWIWPRVRKAWTAGAP